MKLLYSMDFFQIEMFCFFTQDWYKCHCKSVKKWYRAENWYVHKEKKETWFGDLKKKKSAMQREKIEFINSRYHEPHLSLAAHKTALPLSLAHCNKTSEISFTCNVFFTHIKLNWLRRGRSLMAHAESDKPAALVLNQ